MKTPRSPIGLFLVVLLAPTLPLRGAEPAAPAAEEQAAVTLVEKLGGRVTVDDAGHVTAQVVQVNGGALPR